MTYRFTLCASLTACNLGSSFNSEIDSQRLSSIVRTRASDEFEGRAPGGRGEEKTVADLIERFQSLGLMSVVLRLQFSEMAC